MSEDVEKITLDMQAGAVRHVAAMAPANLKPALEAAIKTLAFCVENSDVLRAVALFKRRAPMFGEIIRTWPGTQIADIRRAIPAPTKPGDYLPIEADLYGGDDYGQ